MADQDIPLPAPRADGPFALERALVGRRSDRAFLADPLDPAEIGQLLWAAQGVRGRVATRTAPSAGALYPLEVALVAGAVTGLPAGIYRYRPESHALEPLGRGDRRRELAVAALGQAWIATAPAILAIAAVFPRTMAAYGERGRRYALIEVGHAAQNVYLQAAALGLGTTEVGAFEDLAVQRLLGLPAAEEPLALLPVGRPAG